MEASCRTNQDHKASDVRQGRLHPAAGQGLARRMSGDPMQGRSAAGPVSPEVPKNQFQMTLDTWPAPSPPKEVSAAPPQARGASVSEPYQVAWKGEREAPL